MLIFVYEEGSVSSLRGSLPEGNVQGKMSSFQGGHSES